MMAVYAKPPHYAYEVYTNIKYKGIKRDQLPCVVDLERNSVPVAWIEWCRDNSADAWGWWFDTDGNAAIGFESVEDSVSFKLLCSTAGK